MRLRTTSLASSRLSRCLFSFAADDYDLYGLTARTGQTGVIVRASATTALDRNGVARDVVFHQPAIQMHDLDADSIREQPALLLDADLCAWATSIAVQACTVYARFIEIDTVTHSADGLFYLGNDGASDARLYIDSSGSFYRLTHHNGTSAVTSTLAAAPAAGNLVELIGTYNANGSVQLAQSINEAALTTAAASVAHTPAVAWGATQRVRLNSTGTGGNKGESAFIDVKIVPGTGWSIQQLREFR